MTRKLGAEKMEIPDPLVLGDLVGLQERVQRVQEALDAARAQEACLRLEAFLAANPEVESISIEAFPVFDAERGAPRLSHSVAVGLRGDREDDGGLAEQLAAEISELFENIERAAKAFPDGEFVEASDAARAVGEALMGEQGHRAWLARREAAAIQSATPEAGTSRRAPRV